MVDKVVAPTKKSTSAKSPSTMPAHPSYAIMISSAINTLKERGGSSRQAILKHIVANYKITDAARAQVYVKLAIRKMLADAKLIQVKGSFKLPKEQKVVKPKKVKEPADKKVKKPAAKKPATKAKKPIAKSTKSAPKKPAAKKPVAKKADKKPVAKKPAAKKPVAKKADKKPVAKKVSKK